MKLRIHNDYVSREPGSEYYEIYVSDDEVIEKLDDWDIGRNSIYNLYEDYLFLTREKFDKKLLDFFSRELNKHI